MSRVRGAIVFMIVDMNRSTRGSADGIIIAFRLCELDGRALSFVLYLISVIEMNQEIQSDLLIYLESSC